MDKAKSTFFSNDSGAVAVFAAVGMVVLLGCAALAIDIAHLVSVKRELTKAAEAGALAGARSLWPQNLWQVNYAGTYPNCSVAQTQALDAATNNKVENVNLAAGDVTVEIGRWDYAAHQFTPSYTNPNAARVTTQRTNVRMILAQICGIFPQDMSAQAIAVMDFTGGIGKGCLPIAVNEDYSKFPGTTVYIGFNPDPEDNGGWFSKGTDSVSASTLKDYIENGTCPPVQLGDTINLANGNDTSVMQLLQDQLALHPSGWFTLLPVVDTPKFNHADVVTAFVPLEITEVKDTGNPKYVKGKVLAWGQGGSAFPGGGKYGALSSPKLVQ